MANEQTLESRVKGYWTRRDNNSKDGLCLLDEAINRFAAHGDWDALSRFTVGAMKYGQGPNVKRIIRAAFGNSVKFSLDSKHATGGKFVKVNWPGQSFPLDGSNTYAKVKEAIEKGMGWDSKALTKALNDVLPALEKKKVEVNAEAYEKKAKALAKQLDELEKAGFNLGDLIRQAQAIHIKNTAKPVDQAATSL